MNQKEKQLLSTLLKNAANEFGRHCCNDIPETYFEDWTEKEKKEFNYKLHIFNNTQDPEDKEDEIYYLDWVLYDYFSYILDQKPTVESKTEPKQYQYWDK